MMTCQVTRKEFEALKRRADAVCNDARRRIKALEQRLERLLICHGVSRVRVVDIEQRLNRLKLRMAAHGKATAAFTDGETLAVTLPVMLRDLATALEPAAQEPESPKPDEGEVQVKVRPAADALAQAADMALRWLEQGDAADLGGIPLTRVAAYDALKIALETHKQPDDSVVVIYDGYAYMDKADKHLVDRLHMFGCGGKFGPCRCVHVHITRRKEADDA